MRCEEHWPGVKEKFNCQGFFEIADDDGIRLVWHRLEWAKNLCPENAISVKYLREKITKIGD